MKFSVSHIAIAAVFVTHVAAAPAPLGVSDLLGATSALSAATDVSGATSALSAAVASATSTVDLGDLSELTSGLSGLSSLGALSNITASFTELASILTSGSVNATELLPVVDEFFDGVVSILNSIDLNIFGTDTTEVDEASTAIATLFGTTQYYLDSYLDAIVAGDPTNTELSSFISQIESALGIFTDAVQALLSIELFRVAVAIILNAIPTFITQLTELVTGATSTAI